MILGIDASEGVYVVTVAPGSPADEAGLIGGGNEGILGHGTGGDVIKAIDGSAVESIDQIVERLNQLDPGDSVTLTLERDGEMVEVVVELGEWPEGGLE